jgi:hypothetical protein
MNIRNLIILSLIAFSLSAFIPKENSIIGLYGECHIGYFACSQLELKSDSTFEYYVFYDVGGGIILKGTWKVDLDTLILNTFNQPIFAKGYKILDSNYNKSKEIYCFNRDSVPLFYGTVIINHSDTIVLDENGKAIYFGNLGYAHKTS